MCLEGSPDLPEVQGDPWSTAELYLDFGVGEALRRKHCKEELLNAHRSDQHQ